MASTKCAHCGSGDTQDAVSNVQCLSCGRLTNYDGTPAEAGADASTREAMERRLTAREPVIVGNFADTQRQGADVAAGEGDPSVDGVVVPQGGVHPADHDAAMGQITTETIRTGVHDEEDLAGPAPADQDPEPQSVDPDSKSPTQVEAKAKGDDAAKAAEKAKS